MRRRRVTGPSAGALTSSPCEPLSGEALRVQRLHSVFRPNSATDSVSIRPAIPIHSGHLFRLMAATDSASWRPPRAHAERPRDRPRPPGPTLSATESCETGGGSAKKEAAGAQDHGRVQVEGSGLLAGRLPRASPAREARSATRSRGPRRARSLAKRPRSSTRPRLRRASIRVTAVPPGAAWPMCRRHNPGLYSCSARRPYALSHRHSPI